MPTPTHSPRNDSLTPQAIPSLNRDTLAHRTAHRTLSYAQLSPIYEEIVHKWSKIAWLHFADNHTKTYLTLYCDTAETIPVQLAINQYQQTSASTALLSLPECLLIRTKSTTRALFFPNSILSIDNLCDQSIAQRSVQYRLLAIVCHSNETHSKTMFYKDFQSDCWYVCYDRSTSLPPHSNRLSDEEQNQLAMFIQPRDQLNQLDPSTWGSSLSNLCNHPIVYVYLKEANDKS